MKDLTRSQHRIEAERILELAREQKNNQHRPSDWTIPMLLMASVHATLSLETTDQALKRRTEKLFEERDKTRD